MVVREGDASAIEEAAAAIRRGDLVAFPTETVYGLGADATNSRAVARIFEVKGRPRFNPLIVHVDGIAAAEKLALFNAAALSLAAAFWPGPLTMVLTRRADAGLSDLVSAGLDTVALRVPRQALAQALLKAAGRPLAAPSANRSGHVSATEAQHVASDLGDRVAMVLDGGATEMGLESTVLDVSGERAVLLRPGALTADAIEAVLGYALVRSLDGGERPMSPGQLESHYAPRARVRLNAKDVAADEALLAFGAAPVTGTPCAIINLSPSGDLVEAAANLFSALRQLDSAGPRGIAVMPIPDQGLGEAINDRLRRAAAPRP